MSTMMEPDLTQPASVCENCGGVVVEHGRSWIHADGFYGCGPGTDSTSYALGLEHFEFTQDDLDEAQAEARGEALEDVLREVQALIDRDRRAR
ncbi:hypothetical protein SEA_NHAGOS_53 [Gordonia phage NHagos]|nr:hypothetical protein SEA_NHAGOS_53 [Gordonia phage NHagos]